MTSGEFSFVRLTEDHIIKPFDCGDSELNGFLVDDAKNFRRQRLATTYLLESEATTVAYFSLLNDKITESDFPSGNQWKKFKQTNFPKEKYARSYPAVKIARLAVDVNHRGLRIGTSLMNFIKIKLSGEDLVVSCRYITVDSYPDSVGFYESCGFKFLIKPENQPGTKFMYYDLLPLQVSEDKQSPVLAGL